MMRKYNWIADKIGICLNSINSIFFINNRIIYIFFDKFVISAIINNNLFSVIFQLIPNKKCQFKFIATQIKQAMHN